MNELREENGQYVGVELNPVTREEFDALKRQFFILERTVYGIQQMLGKAAEYQGKPRGRLPR